MKLDHGIVRLVKGLGTDLFSEVKKTNLDIYQIVIFNIKGNHYRLVVKVAYETQHVLVAYSGPR
ncbi:type II toxin-antitoxin system HigB family toxin [Thiohalophilus sp.]|uniref:type II toxin-antitoxin system HigB family toxin n=1 Tax=Thiohalophilus sp. TaxID=3028392 RepID=UPI003A101C3F